MTSPDRPQQTFAEVLAEYEQLRLDGETIETASSVIEAYFMRHLPAKPEPTEPFDPRAAAARNDA